MKNNQHQIIKDGFNWVITIQIPRLSSEILCPTRDIFQARVNKLLIELQKANQKLNSTFLLAAIVGEIGNNSFDHNLGTWRDLPGVYFAFDLINSVIVLADRGQGVFATIHKVQSSISTAEDALKTAFTKIISGRYPERRGNGLKFVRKVIQNNDWRLNFYSDQASCLIERNNIAFQKEQQNCPGVLAIIHF